MPPVRVDADAEDSGVVAAQPIGIKETEAAAIADEGVQLRIRIVGLQHVVARPREWIERVSGLRRIIKALARGERRETMDYAEAMAVNKNRTAAARVPVAVRFSGSRVRAYSRSDRIRSDPAAPLLRRRVLFTGPHNRYTPRSISRGLPMQKLSLVKFVSLLAMRAHRELRSANFNFPILMMSEITTRPLRGIER